MQNTGTKSTLKIVEMESSRVPSPVPCAVLLPPGYDPKGDPYPLCLYLHGGGVSHESLIESKPDFDAIWGDGSCVPMVVVTPRTSAQSLYFDDPGGDQWETFVVEEVPAYMAAHFNVRTDRGGTVMTGASMGGYGTLKLAFRRPDRYCAIAALEPAIEPGTSPGECAPRSRIMSMMVQGPAAKAVSATADEKVYRENSPAAILMENADAIRSSGLRIYLECGDYDAINLHDGTEYLHRLLWDLDVSHEYRLIQGADHVGPSLRARNREALRFLSEAMTKAGKVDAAPVLDEATRAWMEWSGTGMKGERPPMDLWSEEAAAATRLIMEQVKEAIAAEDPTVRRRYGILPATGVPRQRGGE